MIKTVIQAEIYSAAELIDFFRYLSVNDKDSSPGKN